MRQGLLCLSEAVVNNMKIDSYTHFACPAFIEHLEAESGHPMVFRGLFSAIPELSDIDVRIRQGEEKGPGSRAKVNHESLYPPLLLSLLTSSTTNCCVLCM